MCQDTTCETAFEIESIHSEGCDKYKNYDLCIVHDTNLKRMLFMQADIGSIKVCSTNVSMFVQSQISFIQ